MIDDEGRRIPLPATIDRVVSLVPSLTEAVGVTEPGLLVGATDWCTHPDDLDEHGVTRVRGTKNPDIEAIVALRPDIVLANAEENRAPDLDALRAATATPARMLGLTDVGELREGARADLVVLDDDLRVRRVMRSGAWVA